MLEKILKKLIDERVSYDLRFVDDNEIKFFQRCNILLLPYQNAKFSAQYFINFKSRVISGSNFNSNQKVVQI